ncbi:MAG: extracellular solute-binding protein [Selenomonas sp.]|nr:extracellular solute-binding protein [Selenomonas sp.]
MRRYTSLLLTAFLLLLIVVAGSVYLAGAGRDEQHRPMREITVYTTLPAEHAAILSAAYEEEHEVRVNFVPLSSGDILSRLKDQTAAADECGVPMILADKDTLSKASAAGYLVPYLSEVGDQVAADFRQDSGYWVGVWYDPVVFCVNRDYLKTLKAVPDTWVDLAKKPDIRIGVTDFLAADASANLFFSMIAQFGDAETYDIWRQIHPKVVQYARYLSNPVRQAGMGEVDIAIAVESETIRYLQDGYPLKVIYPADGTAAMVTGTAMAVGGKAADAAAARAFADWLLSDEAQQVLQTQGFYFVPTNPGTLAYKTFAGKNMILFNQPVLYTAQQKHDFLDRWVKEIRFSK